MNELALIALLLVFLVHLAAFAVLGLKRRQPYYGALVVTFSLLSVAIALRLWLPELQVGPWPLHRLVRYLGWSAAAVSLSWTAVRMFRAQSGRQNCS